MKRGEIALQIGGATAHASALWQKGTWYKLGTEIMWVRQECREHEQC